MAQLPVIFHVPNWVEVGVRAGDLQVFGGVVRDSAGRIVYMLRQTARIAPRMARGKWALVAGGLAVAAGGAYLVYRRYSAKGTALAKLETTEATIVRYLEHAARQELTLGDVEALSRELDALLMVLRNDEHRKTIVIPADIHEKLAEFLGSLREFNSAAQTKLQILPPPPPLLEHSESVPLVEDIVAHLRYQEAVLATKASTPT